MTKQVRSCAIVRLTLKINKNVKSAVFNHISAYLSGHKPFKKLIRRLVSVKSSLIRDECLFCDSQKWRVVLLSHVNIRKCKHSIGHYFDVVFTIVFDHLIGRCFDQRPISTKLPITSKWIRRSSQICSSAHHKSAVLTATMARLLFNAALQSGQTN